MVASFSRALRSLQVNPMMNGAASLFFQKVFSVPRNWSVARRAACLGLGLSLGEGFCLERENGRVAYDTQVYTCTCWDSMTHLIGIQLRAWTSAGCTHKENPICAVNKGKKFTRSGRLKNKVCEACPPFNVNYSGGADACLDEVCARLWSWFSHGKLKL